MSRDAFVRARIFGCTAARAMETRNKRMHAPLPVLSQDDSSYSDSDDGRILILDGRIKGRAAGEGSGKPRFTGWLNDMGLIRIDCENYLAHWQEIRLPDEVVRAWKEYRERHVKPEAKEETKEEEVVEAAKGGSYTLTPRVFNEDGTPSDKPYNQAVQELLGMPQL